MRMSKIIIVQIRGVIGVPKKIKDSLKHLKLGRVNACRVIDDSPAIQGVLDKVKHLITWGVGDDDTLKLLKERGEGPVFALHPPLKGYGRKGVKVPFAKGGAYGDRKDKINDLIKRML